MMTLYNPMIHLQSKPILSDHNLQQQKQDSGVFNPSLKKKAPKHCRYNLKCTNLKKKGPTKCILYHSLDEIAASHLNDVGLDVRKQVARDVSHWCGKYFKFGLDCPKLSEMAQPRASFIIL
jgi:hypothetical protein